MSASERARAVDLRVVALTFTGVSLVALAPVVVGLTWFGRDLHLVDMGMSCAVKDALRGGSLFIAPHLGNGQPLLADPSAQLLYPLRWPAWLFGAQVGTSLVVALHLGAGAAAAAWLLRTFRARPSFAAAAGVAWIACGSSVDLVTHSIYIADLVWIPFVWAAARAILLGRAGPRAGPALLVLGGAMLLFAGEPQGFGVAASLALAEAAVAARRPRRRRRALVVVAAVLLAPVIAAAALLPAWLEAQWTARNWRTLEWLSWSADAKHLVGLVVPVDLKEPVRPGLVLGQAFSDSASAWNFTPYLGFGLLAFAARGAARHALVAAVAALVFLAFAFADAVPLLPWVGKVVPFVDDFRYPQKYLLPASLAVVVLAFRGLRLRRPWIPAVAAAALAAIALGLVSLAPPAATPPLRAAGLSSLSLVLVVAGLCALRRRVPRAARFLPWVLAATVVVPALGFARIGPRVDERALEVTGFDGVVCETVSSRLGGTEADAQSRGWSLYQGAWIAGQCNLAACHGLTKARVYSPLYPRVQAELEKRFFDHPRYQRSIGCTHRTDLHRTDDGPRAVLVPLPAPAPPVLAAPGARFVDEGEIAAAVIEDAADPLLLLSHPDGAPGPIPAAGVGGQLSRAAPHALTFTPDPGATGPAVVVVNQAFFRGWSATQADRAVPVLRAGGGVMALVVDAGAGPVRLRYTPPGLPAGLAVSLLGALAVAGLVWLTGRARGAPSGR